MAHNVTQGIETKSPINISNIDKNINDDDLVYIDNRSLKIVLPDKENIDQIQEPLRQQLQESLNNAGRKSLAERSVKKPITYKTLNFLINQSNSPRTARTLLDNINKPFSYSMEDLPDFVRQDMKNKRMIQLPKNIHILHCLASIFPPEEYPLPLMKYITTQCLEIDFDSPFDTLEEERLECMLMLVNSSSNIEDLKIITNCIATLSGLESILKLQNKENWEQITLQPATQPCSNHLLEKYLVDHPHESELLPIDAKIDDTPTDSLISNQETIKQLTHEPTIINPCELLNLEKEPPITEEATDEAPTSPPDKPQSKDALQELPNPALAKQTSSASSQGASPEETTVPAASLSTISNQRALSSVVAFFTQRLYQHYAIKEQTVAEFIIQATSDNEEEYQKAKYSLETGYWLPDKLFNLLTDASLVSKRPFFKEKLNLLIEKKSFLIGHPPYNLEQNKSHLVNNITTDDNPKTCRLHYVLAKNSTPLEAMKSCLNDFWIADQGTLIELAYAYALHYFFGTTVFNKHFTEHTFALRTFNGNNFPDNPIGLLIKRIDNAKRYIAGSLCTFRHHSKYSIRNPLGEYQYLHATCIDPSIPTFSAIGLFDNVSLDDLPDKMVYLYNKKPRMTKAMITNHSSRDLKECDTKQDYPLNISKNDLLKGFTSLSVNAIHVINFEEVLSIRKKHEYDEPNKDKKTRRKKNHPTRYPDYTVESIHNSAVAVTQAPASPFLQSERQLEDQQRSMLVVHLSYINKTLRMYRSEQATSEAVYEAFLPFRKFYLELKENNTALYKEFKQRYETIEVNVQKSQAL